jgi:hypothetical protein
MIEIRADQTTAPARADGPQSPGQTRAIAEGINEAFVLLNRATMPGRGGLRYPSDAYSVRGDLSAALDTLPSTLEQMHDFITQVVSDPAARQGLGGAPGGGDPQAPHHLAEAMQEAADLARRLARVLRTAGFAMASIDAIGGDIYEEIHDVNWDLDDEAPPAD